MEAEFGQYLLTWKLFFSLIMKNFEAVKYSLIANESRIFKPNYI